MQAVWTKAKALWKNKRVQTGVKIGAAALVCLCSLLYGAYCAWMINPYSTQYSPDEGNYIEMARRLLSEHVYSYWGHGPDAYVSPGFPLFLAAGMAIFGTGVEGILCIKLVQCGLAACTVALTMLLGWQLTKKYSVSLISGILLALNGEFYLYARRLLTENFYFFTMMLFFVLFVLACQRDKAWLWLVAGAAFAVTVLVRPLVLITAPFAFLPIITSRWKKWRSILMPIVWFVVGFVVICLPWWIRNCVTMHEFILLATQTNPIFSGLAPDVIERGLEDPKTMMGNILLLLRLLKEDFFAIVYWLTFEKFEIIFMAEVSTSSFSAFATLARNVTLYLGLFGSLRVLFSKKGWGVALVFWVYFASSFIFVPTPRYSLQYMPFLAIFAAWLLSKLFKKQNTESESPLAV